MITSNVSIEIYNLFCLFIGIVFFITCLSFAFLWYDYANRNPKLFDKRFSVKSLLIALRLIISETVYLTIATLSKPAGWIPEEKFHPSDKTPIILLHGLFHNRSCWFWIKRLLRKNGYNAIYSLNLPPWRDIETLTEMVARKTDQIRHRHNVDQIAIICHSMGGIIGRNFLQLRGGGDKTSFFITLGTPHNGSTLAPFSIWPLGANAQPSNPLLARINKAPLPKRTKITSIYSTKDNIIIPYSSAQLLGTHNISIDMIGHIGLLFSSRSLSHIIPALSVDLKND